MAEPTANHGDLYNAIHLLIADYGVLIGHDDKRDSLVKRCIRSGMTSDDVSLIRWHWEELERSEKFNLDMLGGMLKNALEKKTEWEPIVRDRRHLRDRLGTGPSGTGTSTDDETNGPWKPESAADQDRRLQREFVVNHILERRTIWWMMFKEHLTKTEILEMLEQDAPDFNIPPEWREGPDWYKDLPEAFPENWRRHDETAKLHQERIALFKAAHERKVARRLAQGHPLPPAFPGDPNADPEDTSILDFHN